MGPGRGGAEICVRQALARRAEADGLPYGRGPEPPESVYVPQSTKCHKGR